MSKDRSPAEIVNQELARFMSNFYRDRFRLAIRWLSFLVVLNVILAGTVFYLYLIMPKAPNKFYASNMYSGVVTELHPLSAPVVQPTKLLGWVTQALTSAFNFNFVNYRDTFTTIKNSFTDPGWQSFRNLLQNSGILDTVINKKLFVSVTVIGSPEVSDSGVRNGHYAWTIQIPLMLTYKIGSDGEQQAVSQQRVMANAIIVRIANLDNPEEIAISDLSIS